MISALASLEDSALIERALEGHAECFEELTSRHQGAVKRRILCIIRNPSDADDLLQEALFKAWRGLSTFRTWLTRIATNEAIMLCRREGQTRLCQPLVDFDALASPHESADQCLVRAEEARVLHSAVVGLPLKYRQVVILRDLEQLSVQETAQRLNSTVPAVKTRLFRGRHLLVRALRRSGAEEFLGAAA